VIVSSAEWSASEAVWSWRRSTND